MNLRLALLTGLMTLGSTSSAAENTGAEYLVQCKLGVRAVDGEALSSKERSEGLECLSYLNGFLDAIEMSPLRLDNKPLVCLPSSGVSVYQVAPEKVTFLLSAHSHQRRMSLPGIQEA